MADLQTELSGDSEHRSIGKYKIVSLIDQGGMGVVHKAYDARMQRHVAIKTIRDDMVDQIKLRRFKAEAQSAGKLNHNKIVAAYEFSEFEGKPFIAMEYVEGHSLKHYFDKSEPFPLEIVVKVIYQLLDALNFMHTNGVIHRDIKPENILLMKDNNIKVTDFGIAHLNTSDLTSEGDVMGTPGYMSPEQWIGREIDERTDIFSTGVIFYQFLTGEKPFSGASNQAVMHQTLYSDPVPASKLNNRVSKDLDAIIAKAIAKNPAQRFKSAKEFLDSLRTAYDQLRFAGRPTTKLRFNSLRWISAAGLLGLSAVGGIGWWSIQQPADRPSENKAVGFVQVTSEPPGAVVLLDNTKFMGITPVRLQLPPGQYHFVLSKDGYHSLEASIDVETSAQIPFDVSLVKIE